MNDEGNGEQYRNKENQPETEDDLIGKNSTCKKS